MPNLNTAIAVKPETLLVQLPAKPEWFDQELARVATMQGKPVFKVVDGQRELHWRRGKWDVKHLLQDEKFPPYIPVVSQVFRRLDTLSGTYKLYASRQSAEADDLPTLEKEVDWANTVSTRAVGRAAWIVEVYISPEELGYDNWMAGRYADLPVHGVIQKVDLLGEFPRDGMYVYCFSVVDDEGNAIAPNRKTIEECKRRWQIMQGDNSTLEQELKRIAERDERAKAKQIARISDNFYQFHGISARRLHHGVVSRPITKIYE